MTGALLTNLPTHERRLPNGLTVLVREDRSAPVVAILTRVGAGYFDEPDELAGISHVLEHMYFKGTQRRGVSELARETRAAGGYLNAGTIYDHTSYYTVLPSSEFELGLDIQSDALRNSALDADELRKELLVIIQEVKRKLDTPAALALESLYALMFDVHRIRRWRMGTEDGLQRLTRDDVWRFYRSLYCPSNIVLVVVGDVAAERAFALVERYYADMPACAAARAGSPPEPEHTGLRQCELAGDIAQTHVDWGWHTPGMLHAHTPALDLLAVVLGQGRAARLYRGVREAGLVNAIHAYNYTPTELGVFGISATLHPEDARAAVSAIRDVVGAVRRAPVDAAELERARNLVEARVLRRLETVEAQADLLAEWQMLGHWSLAGEYLDRLMATTAEELRRVAAEYLALEGAAVLVYRPANAEPMVWAPLVRDPTDAETRRHGDTGKRDAVTRGHGDAGKRDAVTRRHGDAGSGESSVPASPRPPIPASAPEHGVHLYELPNGARAAIKPRPSAPLVALGIFCRGGALHESAAQAGITTLMARTSIKGTATHSAAQLALETEALGGAIAPAVGADFFSWTLSVPNRHLGAALELLSDAALHPVFPDADVERERKVALSDLEELRDDMFRYPFRLCLQAAFGEHPYGFTLSDMEAALRSLTRAQLVAWHRQEVLENEPLVVLVGDVDPERAAAAVAHALEPVQAASRTPRVHAPVWPDGAREQAERRAKAQTALMLGFPGPARPDADAYAFQLLSAVVSGLGGRFFEELRDRRSLAYTVAAYPVARWLAGAFVAYIATSPGREDEARAALLAQLHRLRQDRITPDELARAQRYTVGAWQIRSQTNMAQMSDLADALLLGAGVRELAEYEARINAVRAEDIHGVFERYFDPERIVEGIVRGEPD